jgi:cytochrome c oxidase assembly protein subunit 11
MERLPHRNLSIKLAALVCGMFGFGFALVPLYDVFCDLTGFGGRINGPATAVSAQADLKRTLRVEFVASLDRHAPWTFEPSVASMTIHPGQLVETHFHARNLRDVPMTAQAVPSVAPGLAAEHLRKIECFCFTEQLFEPLEARDMPVIFMLDPALPAHIETVTLAYTFFQVAADRRASH